MKTRLGKNIHIASGVLLLTAGLGFSTGAAAADYEFSKGAYAGSFLTSRFTFTGERTLSTTVRGTVGGLGDFDSHTVTDFDYQGGCQASNGSPGLAFHVENSRAVLSFKKGQLYLIAVDANATPSSGCVFEGDDGLYHYELEATYFVYGGSGDYVGAVGTLVSTSEGVLLEENRADGRENQFGGTTGMFEGSFSTP